MKDKVKVKQRKNCDNQPSELIEALCHLIPDLSMGDITRDKLNPILNELSDSNKLIISEDNRGSFLEHLENDKSSYKDLIHNKHNSIKEKDFNKPIKYIYIPGKLKCSKMPDEIQNMTMKYNDKQNKSDYYIKFIDSDIISGFSIKKDKAATKTNYSIEKCIRENYSEDRSNEVKQIRKGICNANGVKSGKDGKNRRSVLNNVFNINDEYHTKINETILNNPNIFGKYIVNNQFPKLDYKIYECINGKINDMDVESYEFIEYPEAYLTNKGIKRTAVKLFYKLIVNMTNCQKIFRIETRIKGNWFTGSIQFQMHQIS